LHGADQGDTTTIQETVPEAAEQLAAASAADKTLAIVEEVVADKGYHSNQTLVDLTALGVRTYIAEPDRGRRRWRDQCAARDAVYANRRRLHRPRGQALMRQRGERVERPFAHLYRTGALRRMHLRGRSNILKRLLVHGSALNLGLLLRRFLGVGTPRGLQGRVAAVLSAYYVLWRLVEELTPDLDLKTVELIPPFTQHRRHEPPVLAG
jgi:transposase